MLTHPTLDKLQQLRCTGMLHALEEQLQQTAISELTFDERLSLMVDREITERENRRLTARLKKATLKQPACIEDIDFKHPRGLSQSELLSLASCDWVRAHHNILLIGPSGVGKTYLACALGHKACLEGLSVKYVRLTRLLQELSMARGDGQYIKLMGQLAKFEVVIFDDWGLNTFNDEQRRDILEILEDRHNVKSTIVTSQLPLKHWHEHIGDPTLADAILDRLVHSAHKIELKGDSLRKKHGVVKNNLTQE